MSHSLRPHGLSPPGSSVHGIFQAKILEWVTISFSGGSFQPRDQAQVSCLADRLLTIWATGQSLRTHRSTPMWISSPFRSPQNAEQSSPCSTVGTCESSILDTGVCVCLGEGEGTPLQCSRLDNPTDGGAWGAAVHGVTKSRTRLSHFTFPFHIPALEQEMATPSSAPAWRIPRTGSGHLRGRTESDTAEVT